MLLCTQTNAIVPESEIERINSTFNLILIHGINKRLNPDYKLGGLSGRRNIVYDRSISGRTQSLVPDLQRRTETSLDQR
jgi:hypothetical protein